QSVQGEPFHGGHLLVSHVRRGAQRAELRLELFRRQAFPHLRRMLELRHGADVDVDRIPEEARDGTVRTHIAAAIADRVEWIHADEVRALRRSPFRQPAKITEIADAPIAASPNGIEIRDDSECATSLKDLVGKDTTLRHDDASLVRVP